MRACCRGAGAGLFECGEHQDSFADLLGGRRGGGRKAAQDDTLLTDDTDATVFWLDHGGLARVLVDVASEFGSTVDTLSVLAYDDVSSRALSAAVIAARDSWKVICCPADLTVDLIPVDSYDESPVLVTVSCLSSFARVAGVMWDVSELPDDITADAGLAVWERTLEAIVNEANQLLPGLRKLGS